MVEIGSNYGKTLADQTIPGSQGVKSKDLDQKDFLTLMIAQMKNQNPLEPQDNTQFIAQLASFQTLTAMQDMSKAMQDLTQVSQLSSASALVGHTIKAVIEQSNDPKTGMPRAAQNVDGVVDSVTFGTDGATVHIGNLSVPATKVQEVR